MSRGVCCLRQSDPCIRVCILSLLHKGMYLCISHQSDCSTGVCISHQSYHSIWISCTNHGFFANDVLELGGCAQSMTLTKILGSFDKCNGLWPLLDPHWKVEISQDMKGFHLTFCIIFKLKHVFPLLYL